MIAYIVRTSDPDQRRHLADMAELIGFMTAEWDSYRTLGLYTEAEENQHTALIPALDAWRNAITAELAAVGFYPKPDDSIPF